MMGTFQGNFAGLAGFQALSNMLSGNPFAQAAAAYQGDTRVQFKREDKRPNKKQTDPYLTSFLEEDGGRDQFVRTGVK